MHQGFDKASPDRLVAPPDNGQALYVQGLQALQAGDPAAAVSLLTVALQCQPAHPGMRRNLVRALLLAERFDQVVAQVDIALAGSPDDAELHFVRGTALNTLGRSLEACSAFAHALSLRQDHAPTWLNMGNATADLDDLDSAETLYLAAIRLDPGLAEAYASLGYVLTRQGRLTDAIAACEAGIRVSPALAQAHWNLATASLLSGDLARGFEAFEWRKKHPQFGADFRPLPGRYWDGGEAQGKTILVRAEQGLGDAIQFARYLPMIRDRGARPVLQCAPALAPLIRSIPGVEACVFGDPLPCYDAWADHLSLPRILGTTLASIPAPGRYLAADPVRAEQWRGRLPIGRKVGIALRGNPLHGGDRQRSIPADCIGRLPEIAGLHFVSLQHGESADRLGLPDLTRWMTDYAETAALIENLDLVVTVDTSVAHLAGALGKPVWILLPHAPDWRWLLNRSDSPWYASARLLRQASAGDWSGVWSRVVTMLRDFAAVGDGDQGRGA
jgi:tetratricopeptide (TPR) repeat protein